MNTDSHPQAAANTDTVVDRDNPWPGLHAYDERGKDFFKGRRDVARDLLRLIVREDLVLLYGISGLGKTSLLRAGVFPELPPNFLPVYLRLNFVSTDARDGRGLLTSSDLAAQVVAATQESAQQRNVEAPTRPAVPERGLWEYFRRADDGFWGPGGLLMTPVLVFDQFEEIFTRVDSPNAALRRFEDFLHDLANLESGREPPWYESACATDEIMERATYTRQPGVCKVVLSFREDYLANVKGLSRIIPSIDRIFLRLEPMSRKAAARAICEAGQHLIEGHGNKATMRTSVRIIRKVTGAPGRLAGAATVDPALLSLFCRELNEKRKAMPGALINRSLVDSAEASQILTTFYAKAMRDVQPVTRKFVEDTLVLPGTRSRWPTAEPMAFAAGVPPADLETLTRSRILHRDAAAGVARLELTHDVLVDVVLESRAHRLDQEKLEKERETLEASAREARQRLERETEIEYAERQRRRAVRNGLMAGAAIVLLLITVFALAGISRLEQEQRARNWADAAYTEASRNARLSTVLGLRALNESERASASRPLALLALNNAERAPHLQRRIALEQTPLTMAACSDGAYVALLAGAGRLVDLRKGPDFASPVRLDLTDDVFSMAFDPRCSELVLVYRSTAVDRVDLKTGALRIEHLAPALGEHRNVIAAAVSPDSERLLLTSTDPASGLQWLSVFDRGSASWRPPIVAANRARFILSGHANTYAMLSDVGVLSFAPTTVGRAPLNLGQTTLAGLDADGRRMFAVRGNAGVLTLVVVSLPQGTIWSGTFPTAAAAVEGLFSGDRLALTQADGRVTVWDLARRRLLFEVDDAPRFAWSADAERLLTWSTGDSINMWDARTGRSIARIGSHDDPVSGAAMAGHGDVLMSTAGQGLYLWKRPQVDRVFLTGTRTFMTASFNAGGDKVIMASAQSVQVHDAHSGSQISSIVSPDPITALALAPDDKHIAIGTAKGDILIRTLQDTGGSSARLSGGGAITALAFGASERQLAWAAQVAPEMTAVVLRNLATNEDAVSQQISGIVVAAAVDGQRVAVGLHGPHNYRTVDQNNGASGGRTVVQLVSSAASPVATASSTTARPPQPGVMSPPSRPPTQTDAPPPPPLTPLHSPLLVPPTPMAGEPQRAPDSQCEQGSVSLSRDLGFGAAVTSCDRNVMEWRNLNPVLPLKVERPVARVAVSPDGNFLAIGYLDGGITLHHTSLPWRFATIAGPADEITALAFDMPGARLAAARADGSITIYPISGPDLRTAAEQLAGSLQPTADECLRLFGASDQCEEIGAWRLVTQRIIQALRGK